MNYKIIKAFCIKSKVNSGDFAKQYIYHLKSGKREAIVIKKLVLLKAKDFHRWSDSFKIIKRYKKHLLIFQIFEIKPESLLAIANNITTKNN